MAEATTKKAPQKRRAPSKRKATPAADAQNQQAQAGDFVSMAVPSDVFRALMEQAEIGGRQLVSSQGTQMGHRVSIVGKALSDAWVAHCQRKGIDPQAAADGAAEG